MIRLTPLPFQTSAFASLAFLTLLSLGQADTPPTHEAVTPVAREGGPYQRYLQLNDRVKAQAGQVELVFVGDSITQGWEGAGKDVWEHYYGDRKALNLGIGGDRTQHVLWRLDNGNFEGISPRVAVVMIGTNNSGGDRNNASEIVDGVTAVVNKLCLKAPNMKILLLDIFPRGEQFNDQRGKILQVNQAIQKLHNGKQIHYLPIGHHFINNDGSLSKEIMPDFLHLSPKGYEIWASSIEKKLAALLAKTPAEAQAVTKTPEPTPAGNWDWTIPGPDGEPVTAILKLTVDGNKASGSFAFGDDRNLPSKDGSWKDGKLTLIVERDRQNGGTITYQLEGTLKEADELVGEVHAEIDGNKIDSSWSAKRKK